MDSAEVAIDDRHGPKLYARFLQGLLDMPTSSVDSPKLPLKSSRRSKGGASGSSSPEPEQGKQHNGILASLSPITISPTSLAPSSPGFNVLSFDNPQTQSPGVLSDTQLAANNAAMEADFNSMFQAPLPFDMDMLQSMQHQLSDPVWSDVTMPGMYPSIPSKIDI